MRVATVDGLVTLFYDGSKELYNHELSLEWLDVHDYVEPSNLESSNVSDECKGYLRERWSWQQIIVVEGVTAIPELTFCCCYNIKRVIFANIVIRIEDNAYMECRSLIFVKWSINLEFIGDNVFYNCNLSSVFMPPRCREIGELVFGKNENLSLLYVPNTLLTTFGLGSSVLDSTKLQQIVPREINIDEHWLKNINNDEKFALHRVCSSFQPTLEMIVDVVKEKGGPKAFKVKNNIGITPSRYLKENPYTDVTEKEIVKKYVLDMMGIL